jgi:hypothetical protein
MRVRLPQSRSTRSGPPMVATPGAASPTPNGYVRASVMAAVTPSNRAGRRRAARHGRRWADPAGRRHSGVTPYLSAGRAYPCCRPGRSRLAGPSGHLDPMSRAWCWCRRRGSGQRDDRAPATRARRQDHRLRVGLLEPLAAYHRILGHPLAVDHPQGRTPGHRIAPALPGTTPVILRARCRSSANSTPRSTTAHSGWNAGPTAATRSSTVPTGWLSRQAATAARALSRSPGFSSRNLTAGRLS